MEEHPTNGLKTEVFSYNPFGSKLVSGWACCFNDVTLPETGAYTININGENQHRINHSDSDRHDWLNSAASL